MPYYAELCPAMLAVTYSNGIQYRSIVRERGRGGARGREGGGAIVREDRGCKGEGIYTILGVVAVGSCTCRCKGLMWLVVVWCCVS